jgi:DNA polymerase delta subunit 3
MTDAPAAEETQAEASQPEKTDVPEPEDDKPTITVSNGRRRGKRRVMKKKKVKDEDGYLGMWTYLEPRNTC